MKYSLPAKYSATIDANGCFMIRNDVWKEAKCLVLKGSTIKDNYIIDAKILVKKECVKIAIYLLEIQSIRLSSLIHGNYK